MEDIYKVLQAAIKELKTSTTGIPVAFENVSLDQFFEDTSRNDTGSSYIHGTEDQITLIKENMLDLISSLKAQTMLYKAPNKKRVSVEEQYMFSRLAENATTEISHLTDRVASYLNHVVRDLEIMPQAKALASKWATIECPYKKILTAEQHIQKIAEQCSQNIKTAGVLSIGLEDFIDAIATNHISYAYVVQNKLAYRESKEGKAEIAKKAAISKTRIISSVQSLQDFIKVGNDMLIHKCKKDLWKLTKDEDGNSIIEKMYEGDILDY